VVVRLQENPTTGYRWAVDAIDPGVLELVDAQFAGSSQPAMGSGGERTFRFRVKGPGVSRLGLKNWRDWEGDAAVVARFEATVRVAT
jgi:inhibitor of cysteine peptidase